MAKRRNIHIGTSGWHYAHWEGKFYPKSVKKKDMLKYYSGHFHTVEINNSFYNLPKKKTFKDWAKQSPKEFVFAVKASRYITHMKKLKGPKRSVSKFLRRVDALGKKLGPIVFQLPPKWKCDAERLESFLKMLPKRKKYRYAFEFRNETWFRKEVYDLLKEHNAAFCIYDYNRRMSPKKLTADFVYLRLHGPDGAYKGSYSKRALAAWKRSFSSWKGKVKDIYCYFDNDQAGYAPKNAEKLEEMV